MASEIASVASSMQAFERFKCDVKTHQAKFRNLGTHQTKFEDLRSEFDGLETKFEAISMQHEADSEVYKLKKNEFVKEFEFFVDYTSYFCTQLNGFQIDFHNEQPSQNVKMMGTCKIHNELRMQMFLDYLSCYKEYEKSFWGSKVEFEGLRSTFERLKEMYRPPSNQINVGMQVDPDQTNAGIQVYPKAQL